MSLGGRGGGRRTVIAKFVVEVHVAHEKLLFFGGGLVGGVPGPRGGVPGLVNRILDTRF